MSINHFAVTVVGPDKPGIVAEVAGALLEYKANIEDSQMSVLGGYFTVMLMVTTPSEVTSENLKSSLITVKNRLGLDSITVQPVKEQDTWTSSSHTVTVYGADHPGIVQSVAQCLADIQVSIVDLTTRVTEGSSSEPLYIMVLEVSKVGESISTEELSRALEDVRQLQSVSVSVNELNNEAL